MALGDAFNAEAKKVTARKGRKKAQPFTIGQAFAQHPPAGAKKAKKAKS